MRKFVVYVGCSHTHIHDVYIHTYTCVRSHTYIYTRIHSYGDTHTQIHTSIRRYIYRGIDIERGEGGGRGGGGKVIMLHG